MAAFVAWVEGPGNPYWVWNCGPIAASYLLLRRVRETALTPLPEIAFFIVACGVVLFAHAIWLDPSLSAASGAATSEPTLALLPVCAFALGGAAYGLAFFFSERRHKGKR